MCTFHSKHAATNNNYPSYPVALPDTRSVSQGIRLKLFVQIEHTHTLIKRGQRGAGEEGVWVHPHATGEVKLLLLCFVPTHTLLLSCIC